MEYIVYKEYMQCYETAVCGDLLLRNRLLGLENEFWKTKSATLSTSHRYSHVIFWESANASLYITKNMHWMLIPAFTWQLWDAQRTSKSLHVSVCEGWESLYRSSTSPNERSIDFVQPWTHRNHSRAKSFQPLWLLEHGCSEEAQEFFSEAAHWCKCMLAFADNGEKKKKSASNVGLMSHPGKKRGRRLDSAVQAATAHPLCSSPRERMIISPSVISSPPLSIKVRRWNEYNWAHTVFFFLQQCVFRWCGVKIGKALSVSGACFSCFAHNVH